MPQHIDIVDLRICYIPKASGGIFIQFSGLATEYYIRAIKTLCTSGGEYTGKIHISSLLSCQINYCKKVNKGNNQTCHLDFCSIIQQVISQYQMKSSVSVV